MAEPRGQGSAAPPARMPPVADKSTQLLLDALTRAAADGAGTPLHAAKAEAGLFPATAAAKSIARKAVDDGLLKAVSPNAKHFVATESGLQFLLNESSPKQVLEDFVRVLEAREGQVIELLATAGRMAEAFEGLKDAVARVLPKVEAARVPVGARALVSANGHYPSDSTMTATLLSRLPVPVADTLEDLAGAVLGRLSDWSSSAGAGQDCPLPELYRSLTTREVPPTIGAFHDCLRHLHERHQIYLHPWTGPLYAVPEPIYALLAGHNVAYYASAR